MLEQNRKQESVTNVRFEHDEGFCPNINFSMPGCVVIHVTTDVQFGELPSNKHARRKHLLQQHVFFRLQIAKSRHKEGENAASEKLPKLASKHTCKYRVLAKLPEKAAALLS